MHSRVDICVTPSIHASFVSFEVSVLKENAFAYGDCIRAIVIVAKETFLETAESLWRSKLQSSRISGLRIRWDLFFNAQSNCVIDVEASYPRSCVYVQRFLSKFQPVPKIVWTRFSIEDLHVGWSIRRLEV